MVRNAHQLVMSATELLNLRLDSRTSVRGTGVEWCSKEGDVKVDVRIAQALEVIDLSESLGVVSHGHEAI